MPSVKLVWPAPEYLAGYVAALERGWSPDNLRGAAAAAEQLTRIAADADQFLASLVDRDATGGPLILPDGASVPRLPGYWRWIWDGEFCGAIGLRWQAGTEALPVYCLGHIGCERYCRRRRPRGCDTSRSAPRPTMWHRGAWSNAMAACLSRSSSRCRRSAAGAKFVTAWPRTLRDGMVDSVVGVRVSMLPATPASVGHS
jgi:predicted acetyltransferase